MWQFMIFFTDAIGLGGVLFAPLSGGLSLTAVGFSGLVAGGSWLTKRNANTKDENIKNEVERDIKQTIEHDKRASERLNNILQSFTFLEDQIVEKRIGDILVRLEESTVIDIDINVREIKSSALQCNLQHGNTMMSVPGLELSRQVANLNAALNSAEQVVKCTRLTKTIYRGTKTIQEVVSTAKSLNQVTQTAKSLATAKQAAVMTIQASQSMAKSTTAFACVAKGADGVVKTAGMVSSATNSVNVAANVINASGQTAFFAAKVTNVAKAGTAISTTTKGAGTTIKAVKSVKQVSTTVKTVAQVATDSDKAIRTTRITTKVAKISKVSETATKAASISKIGLAINAVVIPLDIYNLVRASENLGKSFEDVKRIRGMADSLEKEMNEITKVIEVQYESISQLHVQLCKVYKDHRIEVIYEYLLQLQTKLGFDIPLRY